MIDVPPEERGSQGRIAAYLREAYGPNGYPKLGPTDLDKIAMMLARSYSSSRPLTLEAIIVDLREMGAMLIAASQMARNDLREMRAKRETPS